jgi:hypothetical protein
MVAPSEIYCKELRARHLRRTFSSPVGDFIKEQCQAISRRLARRRRRRATNTTSASTVVQEKLDWADQRKRQFGEDSRKAILIEWKEQWLEQQRAGKGWWCSIAALDQPDVRNLKPYSQLKKAESSVLFQARTGRIGLRLFLLTANVPGIDSSLCSCGHGVETAEHLLLHCRNYPSRWSRGARFKELATNEETVGRVARHLIQSGRLSQFNLAKELLYR